MASLEQFSQIAGVNSDSLPKNTIAIVGGGAAGFFAAIQAKADAPQADVLILEGSARLLTKVKISGGGRCNVTHACFQPKQLVVNYPRGSRELLGPFQKFQPQDTVQWFANHGVELRAEQDGRMFPSSNQSQTIIDCLMAKAEMLGIVIKKGHKVTGISRSQDRIALASNREPTLLVDQLLLATGSAPIGYQLAESLGHNIIDQVPSLFTFEVRDPLLASLAGLSFALVTATLDCTLEQAKPKGKDAQLFRQQGPMLITHWGLSGPVILRLSAFAARALHQVHYQAKLNINFLGNQRADDFVVFLKAQKQVSPQLKIGQIKVEGIAKRFWLQMLEMAQIADHSLAQVSQKEFNYLANLMTNYTFRVQGKGVFKDEFVTCGGIDLKEVCFKTMASKIQSGLYFAGEILDIDGVTGGFNFQNAWTTAYLAGKAMASDLNRRYDQVRD